MTTPTSDRDVILKTIAAWPLEEQEQLAHAILERVATKHIEHVSADKQHQPVAGSTWDALYGIAASGQLPPTDEQIAEWLDERRMRKYGK